MLLRIMLVKCILFILLANFKVEQLKMDNQLKEMIIIDMLEALRALVSGFLSLNIYYRYYNQYMLYINN